MNKKRNILIVVIGMIAIIYVLTANFFGGKRTKQEFMKFDNSEINGVIKDVSIKHHGIGFKTDGNNDEFIFYPYTSELNDNNIFDHLAKNGDRIIKRQNSDTLILISNNKEYIYIHFNN